MSLIARVQARCSSLSVRSVPHGYKQPGGGWCLGAETYRHRQRPSALPLFTPPCADTARAQRCYRFWFLGAYGMERARVDTRSLPYLGPRGTNEGSLQAAQGIFCPSCAERGSCRAKELGTALAAHLQNRVLPVELDLAQSLPRQSASDRAMALCIGPKTTHNSARHLTACAAHLDACG